MGRFFDYDNGIMSALSKLADCIILALFWLVCSIPIFTIGASTTALYYSVNKSVRHSRGYAWKEYFSAFKDNFKQATIVWLILLGIYVLSVIDVYILSVMGKSISFASVLVVVIIAIIIVVTVWMIYLFPYMARFANSTKAIMKNSALIAIANLFWSILLLALFVVAVVAFFMVPIVSMFVPVIYMVIANRILERIFRKYMSIEDLREEEERNQEYYKELHVNEEKEEEK